jgi:HK97 family phage portal protein
MNLVRSLTAAVTRAASSVAALPVKFFHAGYAAFVRIPPKMELAFTGWSYAFIKKRSRTLAKKRFYAYKATSQDTKTTLPLSHWAVRLLNQPNPKFTRTQVFRLMEEWFVATGNVFIYAPKNGLKYPVQLWVLPSHKMQVVMSDNPLQLVKGYVYNSPVGALPIDEEEIIHCQDLQPSLNPSNIVMGRSMVDAAADALELNAMQRESLKQRIRSQNLPPLVLKTKGRMPDDVWQNFKRRMKESVPDITLVAALEQEGELVPVTNAGTESAYLRSALRSDSGDGNDIVSELSAVYGVPVGLVTGKFENRATSQTLKADFYESTIDPQADYYAEEFTRHFARFEQDILVEAEAFVYTDPEQTLRKQEQELQWGITTINDERKKQGLKPISGGDTPFVPMGFVPLSQAMNPQNPTPQPEPAPSEETAKRLPAKQQKALPSSSVRKDDEEKDPFDDEEYCKKYWKSYDAVASGYVAIFNRTLQGLFDELEEEVLANAPKEAVYLLQKRIVQHTQLKSKKYKYGRDYIVDAGGIKFIRSVVKPIQRSTFTLFDVASWKERFASRMSADFEEFVSAMMQQAANDIGENWEDIQTEFEVSIRAAVRQSTDSIKESVETVKDELQRLLDDMYDKPVEEIAAAIQLKFAHYSAARAMLIARTTATAAMGFSQMTVFEKMGYTYTWLSQRDGKTRDTHKIADMQEPDREGYFRVGTDRMRYPGGGSQAKENAHCRCVLRPKPKKE